MQRSDKCESTAEIHRERVSLNKSLIIRTNILTLFVNLLYLKDQ